jgi:hypothetical protein
MKTYKFSYLKSIERNWEYLNFKKKNREDMIPVSKYVRHGARKEAINYFLE